jgi:hypothetical protein
MSKQKKNAKKKTEIKVRYSDTSTGTNTKKQNSKRKTKEKCKNGKHKIIQHLRQKVADTALDKRKTCKQTETQKVKTLNESLKAKRNKQMQSLQEAPNKTKVAC